ncbi:F-box only protein 30-like [Pecten maximus]|uniref:F-box only protein 30-like n=1 Tax=Pecten maximus TaxID=6579 RepID=UPI001458CE28|nr:F-box only protein 30-like [Pecten maximus]
MSFMPGRIIKSGLMRTCPADEELAFSLSILHAHCEGCHDRYCNVSPDEISSCGIVECSQSCGQRLHQCKIEDHKNICSLEKVPCTNHSFGCPMEMTRSKINAHIRVCPASVIRCVIEWNRWPMHSAEENIKAPLPLDNPHVRCGQLDVALALRDQRMLMESLRAPQRIRKVLQNTITQRYPGVPFENRSNSIDSDCLSDTASVTVSDDELDTPWESTRFPPGLKMSVCSKLYRATKHIPDLTVASNSASNYKLGPKQEYLSDIREEHDIKSDNHSCDIEEKMKMKMESLCIACSETESSSSVTEHPINETNYDKTSEGYSYNSSLSNSNDTESLTCSSCNAESLVNHVSSSESDSVDQQEASDEHLEIYNKDVKLHELLGVSLNIECISKYIAKHPKMYTFLCAQDFRREEYMWHFKNVHNDIHCGLNGVVEQRCPLAYLGCTYSYQRLVPGEPRGRIVHSSLLESFGLLTCEDEDKTGEDTTISSAASSPDRYHGSPDSNSQVIDVCADIPRHRLREATPEIVTSHKFDSRIKVYPRFRKLSGGHDFVALSMAQKSCDELSPLLCLPVEVLIHMVTFLDSFSLCNLSLTCKLLRNVTCSLLVNKGMVTPVWEKVKTGSKVTWKISHKKWSFSTSFTPVHRWHYHNAIPLAEHLKECPYNRLEDKIVPKDMWTYTFNLDHEGTATPIITTLQQLKRMSSEVNRFDSFIVHD